MNPKMAADTVDSLPEEAFLLPWYVNGTLDADERRRVEAALAASADLRDELALLRSVSGAIVASADAMPDPDPDGFDRLMARIDAEPQRAAPHRAGTARRPAAPAGGWMARVGRWLEMSWRPAMAAAAVVIAVQAAAIFALVGDRAGNGQYTTASGPATATGETRFLVGFADGASLAEIRGLLERADATIVKGPTADGYFIVAVQGDPAAGAAALQSAGNLVTQAERMP